MFIAIIGAGRIGSIIAEHLVRGGQQVILASGKEANAAALAGRLGELAKAVPIGEAIADADVVVFAVQPFQALRGLIASNADRLMGKVVVDTSNQYALGPGGEFVRILPEGQSSGGLIAAMLPSGARFVKAFSTLGFETLRDKAHRTPRRVLYYVTDDDYAAAAIERLITVIGFEPVKAGGVQDAGRLELPDGDLCAGGVAEG